MPNQRARRTTILLAAVGIAVGGYFAVMHFVRRHVDERIAHSRDRTLPAFDLPTTSGGRVRTADLRGKKVVLEFFRSRCVACEVQAPALRAFAEEVHGRSDVAVVSVLLDEVMGFPPTDSAATLARHGYAHPVVVADRAFVDAFHGAGWANVTPVTYVTDAGGVIRHALRGRQDLAALRAAIQ